MRRVPARAVASEQDSTPDESGRLDGFVWAAAPLVFIESRAVTGNTGDALPDSAFVFAPSTAEQSHFVADSLDHFAPPEGAGVATANANTDAGSLSFTFAEEDGRPVDYFVFHSSPHAEAPTEGNTAPIAASSSEPLGFAGAAPAASSGLSVVVAHSDFGVSAPAVALPVQEVAGYQAPQVALDGSQAVVTAEHAAPGPVASVMPGPELANAASPDPFAPVMTE